MEMDDLGEKADAEKRKEFHKLFLRCRGHWRFSCKFVVFIASLTGFRARR
jgi:hypothetical protein